MEIVLQVSAAVGGCIIVLYIILDKVGRIKEVHGGECPDEDCEEG